MDAIEIVGVLKYLEGQFGSSPSIKDIAKKAGCSEATAIKYLKQAVDKKLIVQRGPRMLKTYMTLEVARAYDSQGQ